MVTDGLFLLQGTYENLTPLSVLAMAMLMLGQVAVAAFKSLRGNGKRETRRCWGQDNPELLQHSASNTKDIHEIVTLRSDGRPLVYAERGVKDAVVDLGQAVQGMRKDLVIEIRQLKVAIENNGGGQGGSD